MPLISLTLAELLRESWRWWNIEGPKLVMLINWQKRIHEPLLAGILGRRLCLEGGGQKQKQKCSRKLRQFFFITVFKLGILLRHHRYYGRLSHDDPETCKKYQIFTMMNGARKSSKSAAIFHQVSRILAYLRKVVEKRGLKWRRHQVGHFLKEESFSFPLEKKHRVRIEEK